ncbi:MAG: TetR/AcrR family transcriptional regulator [Bryobacteraceae bacterium]|nr:TetR/AcrR family transcriptional regulator [Bryobacteraceae bacterium]
MGRPPEFDRAKAVQVAMQLFLDRGYESTSIDDLIEALGISRASLYNAFGDKHGLLLEAFCCAELAGCQMRKDVLSQNTSALRAIREYFEELRTNKRSCFFLTLGTELSSADMSVRKRVRDALEQSLEMFRELIVRGQKTGEIPPSVDPSEAAAALLGATTAILTFNKVCSDPQWTTSVIHHALAAVT